MKKYINLVILILVIELLGVKIVLGSEYNETDKKYLDKSKSILFENFNDKFIKEYFNIIIWDKMVSSIT